MAYWNHWTPYEFAAPNSAYHSFSKDYHEDDASYESNFGLSPSSSNFNGFNGFVGGDPSMAYQHDMRYDFENNVAAVDDHQLDELKLLWRLEEIRKIKEQAKIQGFCEFCGVDAHSMEACPLLHDAHYLPQAYAARNLNHIEPCEEEVTKEKEFEEKEVECSKEEESIEQESNSEKEEWLPSSSPPSLSLPLSPSLSPLSLPPPSLLAPSTLLANFASPLPPSSIIFDTSHTCANFDECVGAHDFRNYRDFMDVDYIEHVDFVFQDEPYVDNKAQLRIAIGNGLIRIVLELANREIVMLLLPLAPYSTFHAFGNFEFQSYVKTCLPPTFIFDPG